MMGWLRWQRAKFRNWKSEKFPSWLANRLPKSVVYFAYMRVVGHATCTKYSNRTPEQVNIWEALSCWEGTPRCEGH